MSVNVGFFFKIAWYKVHIISFFVPLWARKCIVSNVTGFIIQIMNFEKLSNAIDNKEKRKQQLLYYIQIVIINQVDNTCMLRY